MEEHSSIMSLSALVDKSVMSGNRQVVRCRLYLLYFIIIGTCVTKSCAIYLQNDWAAASWLLPSPPSFS